MGKDLQAVPLKLSFPDIELARQLFGEHNAHLQRIADTLAVRINTRGETVSVDGDPIAAALAANTLRQLYGLIQKGYPIYPNDIDYALRVLSADDRAQLKDIFLDTVYITAKKRAITPKSPTQKTYIDAIRQSDIVFGIGPAGTGKTYLAVVCAAADLMAGKVDRIILSRPAVEAGERLGFLPGDMKEKVDPYLRPLYDALYDVMPAEAVIKGMADNTIEIAPLAFMRGRTLSRAFVILDEAQNTTPQQMKMFLTRLGEGSRMVITGDPTQVDLPAGITSGLTQALDYLKGVDGIAQVKFGNADIVRHPLVTKIVDAYDRAGWEPADKPRKP
jgi:phosphate starvation-inducible PhoH-like protein